MFCGRDLSNDILLHIPQQQKERIFWHFWKCVYISVLLHFNSKMTRTTLNFFWWYLMCLIETCAYMYLTKCFEHKSSHLSLSWKPLEAILYSTKQFYQERATTIADFSILQKSGMLIRLIWLSLVESFQHILSGFIAP